MFIVLLFTLSFPSPGALKSLLLLSFFFNLTSIHPWIWMLFFSKFLGPKYGWPCMANYTLVCFSDTVSLSQACFVDSLSASYVQWIVIERACIKNSRKLMLGTWLLGGSRWKFIKALLLKEIVHAILLFFDRRSWNIVNTLGSDKDWYLTRWVKYTGTESYHL